MLTNIANRRTHVSALPPEILSMILIEGYRLFLQQHQDLYGDFKAVNPAKYLIAISSVCCRWRETTVSTSGLWTQLDLGWSPARCHVWITRAGTTRGLDLSGTRLSLQHVQGVTRDADSFSIIAPALRRWRSISLRDCSQATVARVFERINEVPYTCDQLQEIEIKSYEFHFPRSPDQSKLDSMLWSRHASDNASAVDQNIMFPRLHRVTLLPGEYSLCGMLSNVVTLELHQPRTTSWQHWHSLLTEAPALETLRISYQSEIPLDHSLLLQMDRLHTLEIGAGSHDSFTQCWFENVNAPSLRNLSFQHSWRPEDVGSVNAEWLCNFVSVVLEL